jgi:hypothetical protein
MVKIAIGDVRGIEKNTRAAEKLPFANVRATSVGAFPNGPREVADLCVLHLRSEAFYIPAHQIIYSLVLEFRDKGKPVDFIPLKQALTDRN